MATTDYQVEAELGLWGLPHNSWRIIIHCILMTAQIGVVALSLGVASFWSGLSVPISAFQAFVPRPKWPD